MDMQTNEPQMSSQGPVIGIIVVIVVLIAGAFYFFGRVAQAPDAMTEPTDVMLEDLPTTSTSDEASAIESDLNAEDFSDIDAELEALDAEFAQ